MMWKTYKFIFMIFVLSLQIFVVNLHSFNIKKIEMFYLKHNNNFILKPTALFVDRVEDIFLIDKGALDIKIYNKKGNFLKKFGRKGLGPGEFVSPSLITGRKNEIIVYDFRRRKLLHFVKEKGSIHFVKNSSLPFFVSDMKIIDDNNLVISGVMYKIKDNKRVYYSLALYDLSKQKFNFLLPSRFLYESKTDKEYSKFLVNDLIKISPAILGDYFDGSFVQCPVVNLRLVVINKNNISIIKGRSSKFIKPVFSTKLKKLIRMRKLKEAADYLYQKSYVNRIFFVEKNKIGVIFSFFNKRKDNKAYYLHVYDKRGALISETILVRSDRNPLFYYKRKEKILYVLQSETYKFDDLKFKILKFKMIDEGK